MKAYKILTIITIVILIAILSVASFMGVYKLKDYRVKNVIPNYLFGKEFSKSRVISLEIDDSTKETKIYDKDGNEITEQQDGIEYTEANGYKTVGYFMQSRVGDCIERNLLRTGKAKVPNTAIAATSNRLEMPSYDEGFDELYFVSILPEGFSISEWREQK